VPRNRIPVPPNPSTSRQTSCQPWKPVPAQTVAMFASHDCSCEGIGARSPNVAESWCRATMELLVIHRGTVVVRSEWLTAPEFTVQTSTSYGGT